MTIEAGVVIDNNGNSLFWHEPQDRTGVALPDSTNLWNVLWENRNIISGFAHSHPGFGLPGPSHTDVTTFAAVEAALGKRLLWPIISGDSVAIFEWQASSKYNYQCIYAQYKKSYVMYDDGIKHQISAPLLQFQEPSWIEELRWRSNFNLNTKEEDNGRQYNAGQ